MIKNNINKKIGLVRESNPGPRAPEARIIPLDQQAVPLNARLFIHKPCRVIALRVHVCAKGGKSR